jgi:hypothetical protein
MHHKPPDALIKWTFYYPHLYTQRSALWVKKSVLLIKATWLIKITRTDQINLSQILNNMDPLPSTVRHPTICSARKPVLVVKTTYQTKLAEQTKNNVSKGKITQILQ